MPTGEIRMSNLPLILTLLSVISIGILGFLEMKKLYTKLNVITNKIDDINENINTVKEKPKELISHAPVQHRVIQQIPPHIQHQMMLRRQQEELQMMRKNESINQPKQEMEDNIIYDENKVKNINDNTEKPPPKKRGRKPKENIIKNDNPVFNNSNNNNENLIIRLKKITSLEDNLDSFENKEEFEEINNKCNCSVCWNCCHSFDSNIYGIPVKFINNTFHIYGFFCSLECAARYAFDNFNNKLEIYSLINLYYNTINNTCDHKINLAPEKLTLKMFGGNMDIKEYRKFFKTNTIFNVNIPPIIPINHNINIYENNNNNNNNNNNSKKDLKLYRKNNLPNQENSIKNSMNLITS